MPAFAQKVLFLSTTEESGRGIGIEALQAFQAAAGSANFIDGNPASPDPAVEIEGALSSSKSFLPLPDGTKLIALVSVYNAIDPDRMAEIATIVKTRPDVTVVAFLDGCCKMGNNLTPFVNIVNDIKPTDWTKKLVLAAAMVPKATTAYLNINSIYSDSFIGNLKAMETEDYYPINNVPDDFALYTESKPSTSPSPKGTLANDVAGLFIPQQTNRNGGACLFLTADSSEFDPVVVGSGSPQYANIAKDFIAAATDPNGACSLPPVAMGSKPIPTLPELALALMAILLAAGGGRRGDPAPAQVLKKLSSSRLSLLGTGLQAGSRH